VLRELKSELRRQVIKRKNRTLLIDRGARATATRFGRHVGIGADSDLRDVVIGDYSYLGPRSVVVSTDIGAFCSIASDVILGTGSHPARDTISSHPAFYLDRAANGWRFVDEDGGTEYLRTRIGSDVWLGARVIVRDGVTIGDGVIVGAGAVVVRDLEPYGVYGGVPARLIRHRFPADMVARLLAFGWWNRDADWLRRHAAAFRDPDRFLALIGDPDPRPQTAAFAGSATPPDETT